LTGHWSVTPTGQDFHRPLNDAEIKIDSGSQAEINIAGAPARLLE
jgi:hypothetical protein